MKLPADVHAVVLDLYDTLVYVPMPPKEEQLTTLLGASHEADFIRDLTARNIAAWAGSTCWFDDADTVILSVDVRLAKPQPEIYALALEQLDVEPARAVFVDDHVEYCAGAKAIGMSAFLIGRAGRHPSPPPGADGVIRGLRELL